MSRPLSSPTAALIDDPVTQPGYLAQLDFDAESVRLSTFGPLTWNSLPFIGANMTIDGFAGDGKKARIALWDADAAFRTLCLTGAGIRNRSVTIWKAYAPALAVSDPVQIFYGVGDQVTIAKGKVAIDCSRINSGVMKAPRLRITPSTGFNFVAPPGTVVNWGDVQITLESPRG